MDGDKPLFSSGRWWTHDVMR